MQRNLVILAGGASSRMKRPSISGTLNPEELAQANQRSKALISVGPAGRPLLDYLLYNAKQAGYTHIYLVINEQGELFKEYYGTAAEGNDFHGLKISYAIQYIPEGRTKPFGTADAVFQAVEQFPVLTNMEYTVCNCDNLYSVKALKAMRKSTYPHAFVSYDRDALLYPKDRIARFAVVDEDEDHHLIAIVEKPSPADINMFADEEGKIRVSMNIFKFTGSLFYPYLRDCPIHPERKEKELPTALLNMLAVHPKSAIGVHMSEHVPDLTAKDDIATVKQYLKENFSELNWNLKIEA